MSKFIQLGSEVRVSDPCYDNDVWCKTNLSNVLPGRYKVDVEQSDEGSWGVRNSILQVVHEDYVGKNLIWEGHSEIGVDSGQAGIFCESSYRKDDVEISTPNIKFDIDFHKEGDKWYEKMCKFTLEGKHWGSYETGVVSSSGYGDGGYPLDIVRDNSGNIVGMKITFIEDEEEAEDDDDYDYDTCPECWDSMDWGESLCDNCKELQKEEEEKNK